VESEKGNDANDDNEDGSLPEMAGLPYEDDNDELDVEERLHNDELDVEERLPVAQLEANPNGRADHEQQQVQPDVPRSTKKTGV
jgi:hypothetical protein